MPRNNGCPSTSIMSMRLWPGVERLGQCRAHVVATPAEIDAVTSLGITPWAGDGRDTYIRIVASNVTSRRIRASA
jgi:hypothetical protein